MARMANLDRLSERLEQAQTLFEEAYEISQQPEPDAPDQDVISGLVEDCESVLEWLTQVAPFVRSHPAGKLRQLCERAIEETATIAELRQIQDTYDAVKTQFDGKLDRLELAVEKASVAYDEEA